MTEPTREQLTEALRWELECLWADMAEARRVAHKGCWSMRCENIAERIQDITKLIGPIPWTHVQIPLFREGEDVFERVHAEIGITISQDDIRQGREECARYLETQGVTS